MRSAPKLASPEHLALVRLNGDPRAQPGESLLTSVFQTQAGFQPLSLEGG